MLIQRHIYKSQLLINSEYRIISANDTSKMWSGWGKENYSTSSFTAYGDTVGDVTELITKAPAEPDWPSSRLSAMLPTRDSLPYIARSLGYGIDAGPPPFLLLSKKS